ncbi:MAG: SDR family oxidoreductase [Chloroflexi bacterium]|nr:SDR family oxidoreductase [Chloroflexota bacterium]
MAGSFEGKVAVVTGGNSGIGRATAIKFAQEGAKVVIAARRVPEGEETVEMIRKAGGDAIFVKTDVTQAAEVEAMVNKTIQTYGRLDCAFNNAGGGRGGLTHELTEDDWDFTINVNLKGVWLCMKYEIIEMLKQGGGSIVNDSSAAGLFGFVYSPIYSASKHGVIGLTKSAALQYAKEGIRINAVCPGVVLTPMVEQAIANIPGIEDWFLSGEPIGRFGTSEEIAEATVWLCSDAASFVTGVAMPVDGGAIAGPKML